jgi:hypothetical protein
MRIVGSTGNVGIGTTTPARKLDVSGDVNFTGTIYNSYVITSGTSDTPTIGYRGMTAKGTNRSLYLIAGSGSIWIERTTANIGIGTTSPGEKLTVAGNVAPSVDNANTSGTASLLWSTVYAGNGTINTSDHRLKNNIRTLPYGLQDLMKLRPVSFLWKDRPDQGTKLSGDFDHLLLRPRSTALQLAGQELTLRRVGRLLQGLFVFVWANHHLEIVWSVSKVALFTGAIFGGACLFVGLLVIQATIAFWTIESLELMNTMTYGGVQTAQYPLSIYRSWFRKLFTYVVP